MTTRWQNRFGIIALLATAGLGACSDAPSSNVVAPFARTSDASAINDTQNFSAPFDAVFFGCTEPIHFTGDLHVLFHFTATGSGNYSSKFHFQPQGVSGVGLFTGTKYQATGVTQDEYSYNGPFPYEETYINNFRLIGQGPDNNLLVHDNFHVTVNANGYLTAIHDNFSSECR
ncbi:MAG: hypothetical protein QOE73_1529 [Verrucomicrobiota bacterium]|jgi:hypothetical protein